MSSFSDYGPAGAPFRSARWRAGCAGRWHPFEIAALVVAFACWWPLGLAVLALKMMQRRGLAPETMIPRARTWFAGLSGGAPRGSGWQPFATPTGNTAFDDWRTAEIARLEEERRKLDKAQQEFADHLDRLRRARDKAEFDGFMADRQAPKPDA